MKTRKTFMLGGEQVALISLDKAKELGIEIIKDDSTTLAAVRASDVPENVETFEPEIGGEEGEEIDFDYAYSEDDKWLRLFYTTAYIRACKVYFEYTLDDNYEKPREGTELHSLLLQLSKLTEEKDIEGLDEAKEEYNSELSRACREADAEYDACVDFDKAFEYWKGSTFEDWKEENS